MIFIETPIFTKLVKAALEDEKGERSDLTRAQVKQLAKYAKELE